MTLAFVWRPSARGAWWGSGTEPKWLSGSRKARCAGPGGEDGLADTPVGCRCHRCPCWTSMRCFVNSCYITLMISSEYFRDLRSKILSFTILLLPCKRSMRSVKIGGWITELSQLDTDAFGNGLSLMVAANETRLWNVDVVCEKEASPIGS